jgi:predicted RND superfamily exporter protein
MNPVQWLINSVNILIRLDDTTQQILALAQASQITEQKIMQELDDLVAEVTALKGVEDSAAATIARIAALLGSAAQNATDLATLKAAVEEQVKALKDNSVALSAAIAANP